MFFSAILTPLSISESSTVMSDIDVEAIVSGLATGVSSIELPDLEVSEDSTYLNLEADFDVDIGDLDMDYNVGYKPTIIQGCREYLKAVEEGYTGSEIQWHDELKRRTKYVVVEERLVITY